MPELACGAVILGADEHWASLHTGGHLRRQPVSALLSVKGWSVQKN